MRYRRLLKLDIQRHLHRVVPADVQAPHSEARPHLLSVPLEAHASITASANTPVPEDYPAEICSGREINPHGHNRPVGRDNVPPAGADPRRHEYGRLHLKGPNPIHRYLSEMNRVLHKERPLCGRLPQRNHIENNRRDRLVLLISEGGIVHIPSCRDRINPQHLVFFLGPTPYHRSPNESPH
jgi:hypothetical protein